MAARHKMKKAKGGGIAVAGGNPKVISEAEERKKGGKVAMKMEGKKGKMRLDRPGRKSGGRVGANTSPLSTAHNSASPESKPLSNSSQ